MTAHGKKKQRKKRAPKTAETAQLPVVPPPTPKPTHERASNELVNKLKPGQTPIECTAQLVVAGLASNAVTTQEWSRYPFGEVDLTACLNAIIDSAERTNRNDVGDGEAILMAQAITLNAMFANLARKAQVTEYVANFEVCTRLAFRAQSQCRATLETLASIKNPSTVFAKQANVATGPQQVNYTALLGQGGSAESGSRAGAGIGLTPNKHWRRMTNRWTLERREGQRHAIQRWCPWQHSTGPM
jgi:hypothetical protein